MAVQVDPASFTKVVLEGSRERPVLVDYWAPWCQPCLALAPLLEEVESESKGRFVLAKVDVQRHPDLGARSGVTSIPALKIFLDGAVIAESIGLLTKLQLRSWLDTVLPGEERAHLAAGREAEQRGDLDEARRRYEAALASKPTLTDATLGLARVLVRQGETERAAELVEGLDGSDAATVRLAAAAARGPALEDARRTAASGTVADLHALGVAAAAAGRHREALDALLEVVGKDRKWGDDAGRRTMLDVFEALGPESDLADEYRRRLAMLLY